MREDSIPRQSNNNSMQPVPCHESSDANLTETKKLFPPSPESAKQTTTAS